MRRSAATQLLKTLRKQFRQLLTPHTGRQGHGPLGGRLFLGHSSAIISLVEFHEGFFRKSGRDGLNPQFSLIFLT